MSQKMHDQQLAMIYRPSRYLLGLVLVLCLGCVAAGCSQLQAKSILLVSDATFAYGPAVSPLENVVLDPDVSLVDTAAVVEDISRYYRINPRVLATLYRVTGSHDVATPADLAAVLDALGEDAVSAYYDRLYGVRAADDAPVVFGLQDGSAVTMASDLNAGTVGVMAALAVRSEQTTWTERVFGQDPSQAFEASYLAQYGELASVSAYSMVPDSLPPDYLLSLPWSYGDTWKFSSGPHDYHGNGGLPWSSLDFAPESGLMEPAYDRWIIAPADGVVVSVACGGCQVDIQYEGGWGTRFYHVYGCLVSPGQQVVQGQPIGNPSSRPTVGEPCGYCGGYATGTHVHQDLMYNGAFYPVNGAVLGGWTVHETGYREGYVEHDGTICPVGAWLLSEDISVPTPTVLPITPPAPPENNSPLMRYRMPDTSNYYLTCDWDEFGSGGYGWIFDEWIGSLPDDETVTGTVPLFHYYVSGEHRHYYSLEQVPPGSGWTYGGLVGQVWTDRVGEQVPVYALQSTDGSRYWYGLDASGPAEGAWIQLGVLAWVMPSRVEPTPTFDAPTLGEPTPTWTPAPTRTPTPVPPPTATPTPTPCGAGIGMAADVATVYGVNTTIDGYPVSAGTCISVHDSNGVACGAILAAGGGEYGPLLIRGDDLTTPQDEGPLPGERVFFSVDGHSANTSIEWHPGTTMMVDLSAASVAQVQLDLHAGWNAVSISVAPGNILAQPVADVFSGDSTDIVRIVDVSSSSLRIYYPLLGSQYSDLDTLYAGNAYLVEAARDTVLELDGSVLSASSAALLETGWNLVPFLGRTNVSPLSVVLDLGPSLQRIQSVDGRTYDPQIPLEQNTLTCLNPGEAYWLLSNKECSIVMLGIEGTCPLTSVSSTGGDARAISPDISWCDVMGSIRGPAEMPGEQMVVTFSDPDGQLCGTCVSRLDGTWGVVHIMGDNPATVVDEGACEGDELTIRVNGVLASSSSPIIWSAMALQEANLEVTAWQTVRVPLITR